MLTAARMANKPTTLVAGTLERINVVVRLKEFSHLSSTITGKVKFASILGYTSSSLVKTQLDNCKCI